MSEQIKQLFNTISPRYDFLNHLLSFQIDKSWRRKTIQAISPDKNKPLLALDLCAGTLDLSIAFLKKYPKSKVIALDFSYSMLIQGLKKIPPELKNRIHIVCGDGLKLPFKPNLFDVVFCAYGMRNLDHQTQGLEQIRKVLKPNGRLLVLDFFRPRHCITQLFHASYGKFWLPFMGGLLTGNRKAYTHLYQSIQNFYTLDEYKELLNKNGFKSLVNKDFFLGISSLAMGERQ